MEWLEAFRPIIAKPELVVQGSDHFIEMESGHSFPSG